MFTLLDIPYRFPVREKSPTALPNLLNSTYLQEIDRFFVSGSHKGWALVDRSTLVRLQAGRPTAGYEFALAESLGLIITTDNLGQIADQYRQRFRFLFAPPAVRILVVTGACNHHCSYCHARAGAGIGEAMSFQVMQRAIDFYLEMPVVGNEISLEFQGGETLLEYPLIKKGMDYTRQQAQLRNMKASFVIVTNLSLMNDEIAADIKRRGDIVIATSYDGCDALQDIHRPTNSGAVPSDAFARSMAVLKRHGLHSNSLTTLTRRSLEYLDEIIAYGLQRGGFNFRPVLGVGRGKSNDESLTVAEAYEILTRMVAAFLAAYALEGRVVVEEHVAGVVSSLINLTPSYQCFRSPCGAGISHLSINPNGDILVCDMGRSIGQQLCVGNVAKGLAASRYLLNPDVISLRQNIKELLPTCSACAWAPFCGTCLCHTLSYRGHIHARPELDVECQLNRRLFPYVLGLLYTQTTREVLLRWAQQS